MAELDVSVNDLEPASDNHNLYIKVIRQGPSEYNASIPRGGIGVKLSSTLQQGPRLRSGHRIVVAGA